MRLRVLGEKLTSMSYIGQIKQTGSSGTIGVQTRLHFDYTQYLM